MQQQAECDRIMPVKDGFVLCPMCRRAGYEKKLLHLRSDTSGQHVELFCRSCKSRYIVDIDKGQCFESRSR